jgi:hypothetical protein
VETQSFLEMHFSTSIQLSGVVVVTVFVLVFEKQHNDENYLLHYTSFFIAAVRSKIVETTASLSQPRDNLAAASANDLILFGGGYNDTNSDRADIPSPKR